MRLVVAEDGVLGDVGDGPGADGDDRQARLQLAEDLVDGVLVGVGLPVVAGLQDDRADLPAGVGEQPVHEILEVLVPAAHRGRILHHQHRPRALREVVEDGGQGQEGVGPDLDPVQLEAHEPGGLGQGLQLAPQRGHVGRVVAELGDGVAVIVCLHTAAARRDRVGRGDHRLPERRGGIRHRRLRYISSARSRDRRCRAVWTPGNSGR